MNKFFNHEYFLIFLYSGAFSTLISIFVAKYTAKRNWKQEKFFNLQKKSEEIIELIWKLQDYEASYQNKKKI